MHTVYVLYIQSYMNLYINSPWNNHTASNMQLLCTQFIYIAHTHTYKVYSLSPASFSCCKSSNWTFRLFRSIQKSRFVAAAIVHKGKFVSVFFLFCRCKNHQTKIVVPREIKMNKIISNKTHFESIRMSWSWTKKKSSQRIGMRIFCKCGSKSI